MKTANKRHIGRILSKIAGVGLQVGTALFPEAAPITAPLMALNNAVRHRYTAGKKRVQNQEIQMDDDTYELLVTLLSKQHDVDKHTVV